MSVDSHSKPLAFRESTYLIPTPGLEHRRPPRFVSCSAFRSDGDQLLNITKQVPLILKSWVVIPTALLLIALAIIMEVVLTISDKNYGSSQHPSQTTNLNLSVGFHVPPQKTGVFRLASTQFLTVRTYYLLLLISSHPEIASEVFLPDNLYCSSGCSLAGNRFPIEMVPGTISTHRFS